MIVKDKALSIQRAHKISVKIIKMYSKELQKFSDGGDPAEQIYLAAHIMGQIMSKLIIGMDGYAEVYNISNFSGEKFKEWVDIITKESLEINLKYSDDLKKALANQTSI